MERKDLALELYEVSVSLMKREILTSVSLSLRAGESLALIGPNGAGKSTLLNTINGLIKPDGGRISVLGKDSRSYSVQELAAVMATTLPLSLEQCNFSVEEFVKFGAFSRLGLYRNESFEERELLEQIIGQFKLGALRDRQVGKLSSGERQKVLLASALMQRPKILLLDEPTSFLDPRVENEILTALLRIKSEQKTSIIWVTHHLNLIPQVADRVLALKSGKVLFEGAVISHYSAEKMAELFETRFIEVRNPSDQSLHLIGQLNERA